MPTKAAEMIKSTVDRLRREKLIRVTQQISTAAAQPRITERFLKSFFCASISFFGALRNLGNKRRDSIHSNVKPTLRTTSTRKGKLVPTGFDHSKPGCHSLTVRHISACLLTLMTKVWVRFVK